MEDHRLVNKQFVRWANVTVLCLFCLVVPACSGLAPSSQMPCFSCDDQRLVRIVPLTQGPDQKRLLHHPFDLQRQEWEALLRAVKVRSIHSPLLGASYRGDTEPAFSEEEVRYLGESLPRAFQQASAQEQVVFALARPSEAGSTGNLRRLVCRRQVNPSSRGELPDRRDYCPRSGNISGRIPCLRRPGRFMNSCRVKGR